MDITPVISKEKCVVTGYGGGGFKINGERREGSLLVFPERVVEWDIKRLEDISVESLGDLEGVEILLIGSGEIMGLLDPAVRHRLKQQGIAIDIMDTGAACRTYNILLAEERRVAAALVAV